MPPRKNLTRIISILAGIFLALIVIIIPVGYFLNSSQYFAGSLETEVDITAKIITQTIIENPELWELEKVRIKTLLEVRPRKGFSEARRVINRKNELIAESSARPEAPVMVRSADLYDAGTVVGRIEIARSLRPLIVRTGLIELFMLPLGVLAFMVLHTLPIRTIAKSEQALRQSEEKYRDLFENANDAIFILDADLRYQDVNKKGVELLGYPKHELLAMRVPDLIPSEQLSRSQYEFNKLTDGGRYEKFIKKVIRKDGTLLDVEVSSSAIVEKGSLIGSRDIMRDITERVKMEEEILKSQKLESLGILAGGIAHDFNNLLTGILGNISIALLHVDRDDSTHSRLVEAEKASLRAKNLAQQLLTFSVGGEPIKKTVLLNSLIREFALFSLRGATVKCNFSIPDELLPVEIDEGQINQVIYNLVINAVQASPAGGTIQITAENIALVDTNTPTLEPGKYVRLDIQDFGIGILKEHLSKIFDPFFSTRQSGSGLGLATAYSIVKKHGGLITVESQLAAGSTFHVYLPASDKQPSPINIEDEQPVYGKGNILVMDDEEIVRDVAAEMLKEMGYEVEVTCNGTEALEAFTRARVSGMPFDVVMLDITVPGGLGGHQTIERMIEIDPHVRAIVSSGYSHDPIMSDYRKYGFKGVAAKPYRIKELGDTIAAVMGKA
ncbi:MAG: PAS domain S-box protein [Thermodesulfovibrionales bacterium]